MGRQRCLLALGLGAALAFSIPAAATAGEPEIRHALLQLGSLDAAVRKDAIESLGRMRDDRATALMKAYLNGDLYLWQGKPVFCGQMADDDSGEKQAPLADPISQTPLEIDGKPVVVPASDLAELSPSRTERKRVGHAIVILELWAEDPDQRLTAVQKAGMSGNPDYLPPLAEVAGSDSPENIRRAARESAALIRLGGGIPQQSRDDRLAAARELGEMRSARAAPALQELLKPLDEAAGKNETVDDASREVYRQALSQIQSYERWVRGFEYIKNGLSRGSILILMALGLSITFGLMGVINMAHGELMMIGAYATYLMQQLFVSYLSPSLFNWYFVLALPVSFFAAALCGFLIEFLVVRHLYARPLDTLLATWGVSLILIQGVKTLFGYNVSVNSPTWLRGRLEIMQDMVLPYSRLFIFVLTGFCVLLIYGLMNFTELGLRVRATMQNREMAKTLGVNTRRIDGYTFALGAGIAGVAGYALTLIGNVTPNMGQNYIVESFLVVVTGGVGELAGAIYAGMGLGVLNQILEPSVGAVWGQVLILVGVILFIQRRPAGLFPPKGRLADV
jgi:urea transport system permease protein